MSDEMVTDLREEIVESADIERLMQLLPHRYPFLMIDRIEELRAGKSAIGIKNVTINEPFFQGHFPDRPVMPGVLIVEAMAQTAIALSVFSEPDNMKDKLAFFMSIDKARFRRPVVPGDTLRIPIELVRSHGPVRKFKGKAFVNGQVAAEADYAAMAVDRNEAQR